MLIRSLSRASAVGLLTLGASGCGFLFVQGPPPRAADQAVRLSCTDSKLFPSLDLVWAGFNAIMAIVVATDDLSTNTGPQIAQIAVNAGWVVFSGLSANSGYEKVRDCRAAHDLRATQNNQDDGANAPGLAVLPTSVTELPRGPLPSPSPAGLGAGELVKLAEELEG